jgi:hypothetical protein
LRPSEAEISKLADIAKVDPTVFLGQMSVSSKGAKTYNHACVRNKSIAPPTDLGDRLEQPGADGVAESESMYGGLRVIHP